MTGILAINKPMAYTSHDIIAILRGISGERHIGHTGTLDPNATGVLPVCFGKAARLIEYIETVPKSYLCTARLGLSSDTEDIWGDVAECGPFEFPSMEELERQIKCFKGEILQTPPMYSAIKVKGRKLYSYARSGEEVKVEPRKVTIHDIELKGFYPCKNEIVFSVSCSRGVYVRSICRDLGKALGCGAVMSGLVRTSASGFELSECEDFEELRKITDPKEFEKHVLPLDRAIAGLTRLEIEPRLAEKVLNGQSISSMGPDEQKIAVMSGENLIAIMNRENNILRPVKVFCT